jgi:hypothetical protein
MVFKEDLYGAEADAAGSSGYDGGFAAEVGDEV